MRAFFSCSLFVLVYLFVKNKEFAQDIIQEVVITHTLDLEPAFADEVFELPVPAGVKRIQK